MNITLQLIKQQIQNWIRDKAIAEPDPAKVKAVDTADILDGLADFVDGLDTQVNGPAAPTGVRWNIPPLAPTITANSVTETQSEVNNAGTIVVIPAQTITVPYAASGKKRKDVIVASYTAQPPFYARIAGEEVDTAAIAPTPSLNPNDLFVRYVDVTDGAIQQAPANPVLSLTINGDTVYPGPTGDIELNDVGGGSVDTVNGQVPDGSKNVTVAAQHIDFAPADTGFFGSALLKVKAALDVLAAKVKGITTQQQWTFFEFDMSGLYHPLSLRGAKTFSTPNNRNITSYYFQVSLDGVTYTQRNTVADLNTWVATNITGDNTTGTSFFVYPVCTARTNTAIPATLTLRY